MKLNVDESRFDKMQIQLMKEIVDNIHATLVQAGINDRKQLQELTENLAFGFAAIIDGSAEMTFDKMPLIPHLCFAADEDRAELVASEDGSSMHDYALCTVEQLLEGQ